VLPALLNFSRVPRRHASSPRREIAWGR